MLTRPSLACSRSRLSGPLGIGNGNATSACTKTPREIPPARRKISRTGDPIMRVAHFDCFSGISGDMTLAALFDLGVPSEPVLTGIASLGLPINITIEKVRKGGFAATQIFVDAPPQEDHRHLPEIEAILSRGKLTPTQLDLALKIFRRLAAAEGAGPGVTIDEVHFHEVGALDSIADVAGSAIALDLLGVE